uniref:Uncharacterized protein n=1 Tax=Amphimedon queenslandica TaxID=400682 RepID=A0A1X7SU94_AMPQE
LDKKLQEAVRRWLPVREQLIKETRDVAETLQENHRKVNMSRIVGSALSINGTALAVIGIALIPVSMLGSLTLAIFGMIFNCLGGAIVALASIAEFFIEKWKIRKIKKLEYEDQYQLREVREKITKMKKIVESLYWSAHGYREGGDKHSYTNQSIWAQLCCCIQGICKELCRCCDKWNSAMIEISKFCNLLLRVGGATVKGASIVLNVILIPIDIIEIKRSSSSLDSVSTTYMYEINKLMKKNSHLNQEMEDIIKEIGGSSGVSLASSLCYVDLDSF